MVVHINGGVLIFLKHIDLLTHNSGHSLDYIITRKDCSGASNFHVSDLSVITEIFMFH